MKVPNKFEFMALSARGWLDELYKDASHERAPARLKNDFTTAMRWLGLEKFSDIRQEHYERWSAGYVCYLAEGKAPSTQFYLNTPSELQRSFDSYAKWAREDPLPFVALNDDIRGVFGRLLGGDDAAPNLPPKGPGFLRSLFGLKSR
jgi:hypothetical protein